MKYYSLCIFMLLILSLIQTEINAQSRKTKSTLREPLPKPVHAVDPDNDGIFEVIELEKENYPQPIQGIYQFTLDFNKAMRYPASARENSIGGMVIINIEIDESGRVTNVVVKKSLSEDCDNAALKSFQSASYLGYHPFLINNKPTKIRFDLPVGFYLE